MRKLTSIPTVTITKNISSREDAEDLDASSTNGYAHAPHWPGVHVSSSDDTFYETFISHFCLLIFIRLANLHGGSR